MTEVHNKKQFHIMTVGNSLKSNIKKYWNIEKPTEEELKKFLNEIEKKSCSELNSFLSFCNKNSINPKNCIIYLLGTDTDDNKIILRLLRQYFKEVVRVNQVLEGKVIPPATIEEDKVINGLKELLNAEIRQVIRRQKEGYEVYFCASGGYKPHVIFTALAGYFSQCDIYYINEDSDILITFPPMLLTLNMEEREVIRQIYNRSGHYMVISEYKEIFEKNLELIETLVKFDFLTIEYDEKTQKPIRIFLTEKCKLYIEKYLKQ